MSLRRLAVSWRHVCILQADSSLGRTPLATAKLPESCRLSFMTLQTAANKMAGSCAGARTSACKSGRDFACECQREFLRCGELVAGASPSQCALAIAFGRDRIDFPRS